MRLVTGISIVLLAVLVACSSNIDDELLEREQLVNVLISESPMLSYKGRQLSKYVLLESEMLVHVYLAKECIDKKQPSVKRFRDYGQALFSRQEGYSVSIPEAARIVDELTSISKTKRRSHRAYSKCLLSYFYPVSMAHAQPAIHLVMATKTAVGSDRTKKRLVEETARWLTHSESRKEHQLPLLTFLDPAPRPVKRIKTPVKLEPEIPEEDRLANCKAVADLVNDGYWSHFPHRHFFQNLTPKFLAKNKCSWEEMGLSNP